MPEHQSHPSPEVLTAFSLGQLPLQDAADVETHISVCDPCCETLLELSTDDTFVALLKDTKEPHDDLTLAPSGDAPQADRWAKSVVPSTLAEHPRYEIVGLIAKGGMGDVLKARHRMMERTVALKVINRELMRKPEAVERFHREVKAAARLSHPNIVTAYDAEQAGVVHYLVMEYVDGVDLARLVKDRGPLPATEACEYVRQTAIGLQCAHEQGMVHRDIKPHNLMLTGEGTVKILDFGLASLAVRTYSARLDTTPERGDLTAVGAIMGTPDYIAPEQAEDAHQADIRSDIYSLGATLYFLLSGHAPFAEGSVMQKLKSHAEVDPQPISSIRMDVPDELADVIGRMMSKNPADRFQAPSEVADALAPFVDAHRSDDVHKQSPKAAATLDAKLVGQFKSKSRVLWAVAMLSFVPAWILLGNIDWFAAWPRHISLPVTMGILLAFAQGILIAVGAHSVRERQWHGRCVRAARLSLLPLSPWAWPMLGWAGLSSLRFLQRDDVKAAFAPEPDANGNSHWPSRLIAAAGVAGWLIASGIVIHLVTDSGTLVIEAVDETVNVRIWKVADETRDPNLATKMSLVDTVTGSRVIRLPSGAYKVLLADEESGFQLNQDGFTLSRGSEVIVKMTKKEPQQPDSVGSTKPVANDATRKELLALIQAARGATSDDELQSVLEKQASVLSALEIDAARALTGLLTDLPDKAHQALLRQGYLKWRFESLDEQRQSAVRTFLKILLSQAENMGFPAGITERTQVMLATADVGFAVLTIPDSTVQFVAWYLLLPHAPIPMMFPLTGVAAKADNWWANRSLFEQLNALFDKPYSDLPTTDALAPALDRPDPSTKLDARPRALNRNSLGMTWRLIPAGSFHMGTAQADVHRIEPDDDWFFADFVPARRQAETPRHRVTLTKSFYMAAHEVTVAQFRQFVEATGYKTTAEQEQEGYGWRNGEWQEGSDFNWLSPGFEQTDDHPVCNVSWDDAKKLCRWLSEQEGVTYRLPTEAEWEYACRAGTTTQFSTGDDPNSLQDAANLADDTLRQEQPAIAWAVEWEDGFAATAPVGSFAPNAFGLYDMHGNVWEWCEDVYDRQWYETSPADNPLRRGSRGIHVFRGGGFDNWPGFLRSADRYSSHSPTLRSRWAGFRVVREPALRH